MVMVLNSRRAGKIASRYGLEEVPCPACGHDKYRVLYTKPDNTYGISDVEFPVVCCNSCRFVYLNPRPDAQEIHKYYPPIFFTADLSPEQVLAERKSSLDARLKLVEKWPPGRVLDIGCSRGEFLHRMRDIGWKPFGIDFSATPPNMFNVPVYTGDVHDAPYERESFDLVTLWAVLEHTRDPFDMLKQVRSFMKPNGRALILVPNFNSIPGRFMRHDDVPRHLVMFTPRSLRDMSNRAGLKVRSIRCGDEIFSGSTRGVMNYAWKLIKGERMSDIVAQNRASNRWAEFSTCIHGKPNDFMLKVDRFDIRVTKYLDKIMNTLGYGFTMTAELEVA